MTDQVIVAIPDNGIRYNNIQPQNLPYLYFNEDEIPFNDIDDDGNGFVDDVTGALSGPAYNGYYLPSPSPGRPSEWHGHSVTEHIISQFIAAETTLGQSLPVEAMPTYYYGDLDKDLPIILSAIQLGARVINLSIRVDAYNRDQISKLAKDYDVIFVGMDRDTATVFGPDIGPNNTGYDNFIEVGLISTDTVLGTENVDLLAEGHVPNTQSESSAIALTSGQIGAIWAVNPSLSASEVIDLLEQASNMNNPIIGQQGLSSEMGGAIDFDLALSLAQASLGGGNIFGDSGDNQLTGGAYADTLHGGDGDDTLDANAGPDKVYAGSGNDSITGGDHNDALFGDGGNDTIDGGAGNDRMFGGLNADVIRGGTGNDTLAGGGGDDLLTGDDGDDKFYGDLGDDTLDGGDGNNVLTAGEGNDLMTTGSGIDRLVGQDGNDTLSSGAGRDQLNGGAGDDSLSGGDGEDRLLAGSGHDTLDGGRNDDTIFGGSGDDSITGGGGNDRISAQEGNDTIEGGFGADIFIFSFSAGDADSVTDFNVAEDTLIIRGFDGGTAVTVDTAAEFAALDLRDDMSTSSSGNGTVLSLHGASGNHHITFSSFLYADFIG